MYLITVEQLQDMIAHTDNPARKDILINHLIAMQGHSDECVTCPPVDLPPVKKSKGKDLVVIVNPEEKDEE